MSNTKTSTQLQTQETQRRNEERKLRQQNHNGQTTMRSPLARLLVTSLRTTMEKEKQVLHHNASIFQCQFSSHW